MKKLRSIILLLMTAVLLAALSSFAGYKVGFGKGFEGGFKIGFIVGARQIFSALTGKSPDELQFTPPPGSQDK